MIIGAKKILEEILSKGKVVNVLNEKEKIEPFITKEINGDELLNYLVIPANLDETKQGLLVYLLTSAKIIKIEIDKQQIQSVSSYLKEVTGVNRALLSTTTGNNARVVVEFSQGSFGIQYPTEDEEINSFFQKVDEAVRKIKGSVADGK